MKVTIEFHGDTDAFYNEDTTVNKSEYSRILRCLASRITDYDFKHGGMRVIDDIDGNKIGFMKLETY
jgi:hypothetical protein